MPCAVSYDAVVADGGAMNAHVPNCLDSVTCDHPGIIGVSNFCQSRVSTLQTYMLRPAVRSRARVSAVVNKFYTSFLSWYVKFFVLPAFLSVMSQCCGHVADEQDDGSWRRRDNRGASSGFLWLRACSLELSKQVSSIY